MKNDAHIGGRKVSVRPTLLVTVMGIVPDCRKALTTDFMRPGNRIYLLGEDDGLLGGSFLEKIVMRQLGPAPAFDVKKASVLYRRLSRAIQEGLVASCHDVSDGGTAVALAECCLGGRTGARIDFDAASGAGSEMNTHGDTGFVGRLFGEGPGRLIVEVSAGNASAFEHALQDSRFRLIGTVEESPSLEIRGGGHVLRADLDEIEQAWKKFSKEL